MTYEQFKMQLSAKNAEVAEARRRWNLANWGRGEYSKNQLHEAEISREDFGLIHVDYLRRFVWGKSELEKRLGPAEGEGYPGPARKVSKHWFILATLGPIAVAAFAVSSLIKRRRES